MRHARAWNHHGGGEQDIGSTSTIGWGGNSDGGKVPIHVLAGCLSLRVVELDGALHVGLIDVVEASEMDAAQMDSRDIDDRVLEGLEFDRRTGLNAVGVLAILIEADDGGRLEEAAAAGFA